MAAVGYSYDGHDNISQVTDARNKATSFTFDDFGRKILATAPDTGNIRYSYDADGNIVSADGTFAFVYDGLNRLIQVNKQSTTVATYGYDSSNRRIRKTVGTTITHYLYDLNNHLIAETLNGTKIRDYIYLDGEPFAIKEYKTNPGIYYFVNDHLGTPQQLVTATGTVVWQAAYLPFGKAQITTGTVTNNLRFPGQYYDEETGLHYNWNRFYDPELGRYISADPIGLRGGMNLYAYVGGNPVNWFDPSGLTPQDRVNWGIDQYLNNKDAWKGHWWNGYNHCNEFVSDAHTKGDPDASNYPTVLRNNGYPIPRVSDLADPNFAPSQLENLSVTAAQPGDIFVWYGEGHHHSALYIGDGNVIYQHWEEGLKKNTISGASQALGFNGDPIVRRYPDSCGCNE